MIKSIAIEVTNKSFLPESYAYRDYFRNQGYQCEFIKKGSSEVLNYDAVILFHGFHPFWKKYPNFIIGEYHSLSTGSYSRFKDLFKRIFNVRADVYVFLNEEVRKYMLFSKNCNYITRSMGYSGSDFNEFKSEKICFDIVYCGSFRKGLFEEIKKLADMGLLIAMVGPEESLEHDNITSFGRKDPKEARKIISRAKYGLNYTPDIFPLNIQDSTKVIEYCAAGLGVITNRYYWVDKFEKERNAAFLNLDEIKEVRNVHDFKFVKPDISDLEWKTIIDSSGIKNKLFKF